MTDNNKLINTSGIQLKDAFVVIVTTEWNSDIVNQLEEGCKKILKNSEVTFKVIKVPGAFEIPFVIHKYWQTIKDTEEEELLDEEFLLEIEKLDKFTPKKIVYPDAFIALGCVIKGDTPHFDYVCAGVTQGIANLNTSLPVPTIYGLLTVNNVTQAAERLGGVHGHKGEEAAAAAIRMIVLAKSF